jgi:hypothetical protein
VRHSAIAAPEPTRRCGCSRRPLRERAAHRVEQLADDVLIGSSAEHHAAGVQRLPLASPAATPRLAIVISRSTNGRSSFAFGIVVSICSCAAARWPGSQQREAVLGDAPSFRCATLCLMTDLG